MFGPLDDWAVVIMGGLAYPAGVVFDLASLWRIPLLKQVAVALLFGLQAAGIGFAAMGPVSFVLPFPVRVASALLAGIFALLVVWSFFIEIPLTATWILDGGGSHLVTTGTYALVRHPGVLWFTGFLVSLLASRGTSALIVATPIWILLDIAYVFFQEQVVLTRLFPDYPNYQRVTPMLIPTPDSFRRCLDGFIRMRKSW